MDYAAEKEKMDQKAGEERFRPETGTYHMTILSEPEEITFHDEKKGKDVPQIKLLVCHDQDSLKKPKEWYISKAFNEASLYYQLITLGKNKGKLVEAQFDMIVQGEGKQKRYTIPDAVDIIKKEKQEKEEAEKEPETETVN